MSDFHVTVCSIYIHIYIYIYIYIYRYLASYRQQYYKTYLVPETPTTLTKL